MTSLDQLRRREQTSASVRVGLMHECWIRLSDDEQEAVTSIAPAIADALRKPCTDADADRVLHNQILRTWEAIERRGRLILRRRATVLAAHLREAASARASA